MNQRLSTFEITQLRETRGLQATIEARFITLDLNPLPPALRGKLRQSFGKAGASNGAFLTDEDTAAILKESQKQKQSTIVTAPRVTLFNGQRAYVQVATERAYVSGFSVVKGEKGETRYEPYVSVVPSGVLLDVQATASADRKYVVCTLKPKITQLEDLVPAPWDAAPPGVKDLYVQVPRVLAQELQTTVTIPDGGTLLIGGFVESADALPQRGATTAGIVRTEREEKTVFGSRIVATTRPVHNLYMLVKPTLIVRREADVKP